MFIDYKRVQPFKIYIAKVNSKTEFSMKIENRKMKKRKRKKGKGAYLAASAQQASPGAGPSAAQYHPQYNPT
jgi:hypothetical protein